MKKFVYSKLKQYMNPIPKKSESRINYSISLKLALIVTIISAIVIFSLAYININEQSISLENVYSDKGIGMSQAIDAFILSQYEFENNEQLQYFIFNLTDKNPEVTNININIQAEDKLITYYSTNLSSIGKESDNYNNFVYENDAIVNIPSHSTDSHSLKVIVPVNQSGKIIGTYEIILSMNDSYNAFYEKVIDLIIISIIGLLFLIISILFLLRIFIVKPILFFRDTARLIGEGDLEKQIKIYSKDEIGELSDAFNKMTLNLKKYRNEINEYNEKLKDLIDQKDEFIGQLGHDLKNPLQPLVGLLPVMIEIEDDPKKKEHLKIMYKNVEYMKNLIIKTLQLARLRSPAVHFDIEEVNLRKLVENVIETEKINLKEKNILLENKVDNNTYVKVDQIRMTELLSNLLSNAIKYTPENGGLITIDSIDNNGIATVKIKDTGIGMDEDEINNVFNEFFKADQSRHEMSSTGLGLSICKRIVEKHGGKIWAESPGKGQGSIFYFTINKSEKNLISENTIQ